MINKIHMESVASYANPTELITDKKVNLIYGLNGTGKSTISNFLYDMSRPEFENCNVDSCEDKKVLVYNQSFIEDYFYEAENIKGDGCSCQCATLFGSF